MRSLNRRLNMPQLLLPKQSVCFDRVNLLHIVALTLCPPRSDEVGETGALRVKRPVCSRHARASGKACRPPERSVLLKINHTCLLVLLLPCDLLTPHLHGDQS